MVQRTWWRPLASVTCSTQCGPSVGDCEGISEGDCSGVSRGDSCGDCSRDPCGEDIAEVLAAGVGCGPSGGCSSSCSDRRCRGEACCDPGGETVPAGCCGLGSREALAWQLPVDPLLVACQPSWWDPGEDVRDICCGGDKGPCRALLGDICQVYSAGDVGRSGEAMATAWSATIGWPSWCGEAALTPAGGRAPHG
mmetsp:Transcript_44149/g.114816  ORF Transcript_44149/g.114816 Transcript_44149/m.114816 type:complete len:195 (+) Transcript_44149:501-1085(+)